MKKLWIVVFGGIAIATCVQASAEEIELRETACRLYDSRHVGGYNQGGKITSATIETMDASLDAVTFTQSGRSYNMQGGESGCRVSEMATGVVLNIVVFQPDSVGNATIWAYGAAQPLSTSINSSGALNEATGLQVSLGADGTLSLAATITGAHYVVDLAGEVRPGVTAILWGEVIDKQLMEPSEGHSAYVLTLDNGTRITCTQPYTHHENCNVPIGSTVHASGHVLNFFGVQHLYAHGDVGLNGID